VNEQLNYDKWFKELQLSEGLLLCKKSEIKKTESRLQAQKDSLRVCKDNLRSLKSPEILIVDLMHYRDSKEVALFTEEEVNRLKVAIIELKNQAAQMEKAVKIIREQVELAKKVLEEYGQVIQFPNLNNQQSSGTY
jgi:hypothetical protein